LIPERFSAYSPVALSNVHPHTIEYETCMQAGWSGLIRLERAWMAKTWRGYMSFNRMKCSLDR